MSLVRLVGAVRYYGADLIVGPLDLEVGESARIGLVGPNGSGKSTLLRMLAGAEPDEGSVIAAKTARIELLRQEIPQGVDGTLFDFVRSSLAYLDEMEARLRALEQQMGDPGVQADPEAMADVMASYTRATAAFEQAGGYERDARVKGALFGLGFSAQHLDRPFDTLSGGQKSRAELARVLLTGADLLLLDEPTNHLDLDAVLWLQGFLQRLPSAYVVVSHDRALLDAVTGTTWEVEGTSVIAYPGNYSASRLQAAMRRERMAKLHDEDRRERERLEAYIRKYKAGNRATQAKSREKRLMRMDAPPPPPSDPLRARFKAPTGPRSEKRVCTFDGVSLGYQGRPVLENVSFEIERGDRIGIAGPNGAGKSTILKAIAGELEPLRGVVDLGRGVVLRYFSQHRTDLDPQNSVLDEALGVKRQETGEARSFLARFLFRGDDVFKRVGSLSGGEKSRLALAKLLLHGGNLFLLDEPTNHLDIGMREALEEALDDYEGTLLFVSHDRSLLQRAAQKVWWVDADGVRVFDEGYPALAAWMAVRGSEADSDASGRTGENVPDRPERSERSSDRERSKVLASLKARLSSIEDEVDRVTAEKSKIENLLADPAVYADGEKAADLAKRHAALLDALAELEEEWGRLAEAVE